MGRCVNMSHSHEDVENDERMRQKEILKYFCHGEELNANSKVVVEKKEQK